MPVPLPNFVRRHVCRSSCIGAVHTCVRHQAGGPQAAIRQKPSFLLERKKYGLRTSTSASAFPSRSPVAISDSTTFSASDGGVDAYSSGLACLVFFRNPSRAHVRLPWLSFVGLRPPCLDGGLSSFA